MREFRYALIPAICVFFIVASRFNVAPLHVELRIIGLLLLGLAILVMALNGLAVGLGVTSVKKTEAIMAFSFYASIAGLIWMAIYLIAVGVRSLRTMHDSQHRNRD